MFSQWVNVKSLFNARIQTTLLCFFVKNNCYRDNIIISTWMGFCLNDQRKQISWSVIILYRLWFSELPSQLDRGRLIETCVTYFDVVKPYSLSELTLIFMTIGAFSFTKKGWWKASVSSFSLSSSWDDTEDNSPRASFLDRCLQKSVSSSTDFPVKYDKRGNVD